MSGTTDSVGGVIPGDTLDMFIPEPQTTPGVSFGGVLGAIGSTVSQVTGMDIPGLPSEYVDLINKQIEVQQEMQVTSLYSNIEKSKHETQMAAIRNIRTG